MTHTNLNRRVLGTIAAISAGFALVACSSDPADSSRDSSQQANANGATTDTRPSATENDVYIRMTTSKGDIVLELDNELAPISTKNFLAYVDNGHYNGTIFHRVIDGFMIQGGGFTPDMNQKDTMAGIENEWQNGLSNMRGTIAMARLGGQANSATAQFFINVSDNDFLDQPRDGAGYAVFGKVVDGMDVVDAIKGVPTTTVRGMGDVPVEPVVIESVSQITASEAGVG